MKKIFFISLLIFNIQAQTYQLPIKVQKEANKFYKTLDSLYENILKRMDYLRNKPKLTKAEKSELNAYYSIIYK